MTESQKGWWCSLSPQIDSNALPSWQHGRARKSILEFAQQVTDPNDGAFVPPEARVAVFDNDGTLWCEKPLPVQADFLFRRIGEMAKHDPSLRSRQPWKAVSENDYRWLGNAITKHYDGDDSDLHEMAGGLLRAYEGVSIDEFEAAVEEFLSAARHPASGQPYAECTYAPMVELLRFLESHGFTNYIVSGGGRDFMRVMTQGVYGIPPERVIGSSVALAYDADRRTIVHGRALDIFDDGPEKVLRIWSRLGRRPILACGNSNGDIEMLEFTTHAGPSLGLLVFHDDSIREFSYATGAERAVDRATREGWPIVSIKNDWHTVYRPQTSRAA